MVGRAASGTIGGLNVSGRAMESSKLPPKSERIEGILNLPEVSKEIGQGRTHNLKIICVKMRANEIVRGRIQCTSILLGMKQVSRGTSRARSAAPMVLGARNRPV